MPLTLSTGSANPTPADAPEGENIAVLTPMSRPLLSSSGPPELPGLMAASVCMTPRMGRPVLPLGSSRPRPLTMPVVRVWSSPKGFPMANTFWPTSSVELLPSGIGLVSGLSTLSTATSLSSSYPKSFASYVFESPWNVTAS